MTNPIGLLTAADEGFTHQVVDLIRAIAGNEPASPDFAEATRVQRVLAAVEASAGDQSRITPVNQKGAR